MLNIAESAALLRAARKRGRTIAPLSRRGPLSVGDAYAIQRALTAIRLAEGEQVVGWKLGYTSRSMREQMGVDAPNYAPITDKMLLPDGIDLGGRATQPRAEPEIAVRLGHDLAGPVDLATVQKAIVSAFACLEIVDSVFTDYAFTLEDNTADGSSAAYVVLGADLGSVERLETVTVRLERNHAAVASATGAAADGHPLAGVAWLAAQVGAAGEVLAAGQVIITGGLTAAVPLDRGDVVQAVFNDCHAVSIHRS